MKAQTLHTQVELALGQRVAVNTQGLFVNNSGSIALQLQHVLDTSRGQLVETYMECDASSESEGARELNP
jgi:hypothetical protein